MRNLLGLVGLLLIAGLLTLGYSDPLGQSTSPALSLSINQTTFAPGHTGILSLTIQNPGIASTVDFYFGAILPDGDTIVLFTESGFTFGSLSNPATLRPLKTGVDLSSPFTINEPRRLTYTWAGTEPPGNYIAFFAMVAAGILPDNVIDPADTVALSTTTFNFNPSSGQVGTTEASAIIGPAGGTVEVTNPSSPLFRTKIVIPPGALDSDIPITIRTVPALPSLAGGAKFGGPSIDFGPTGLVFRSPVSVTIPYADANSDGLIDNTNVPEEFLPAYFHDDVNREWMLSPNRMAQDTVSKIVTLEVTHFTISIPFFLCLASADLKTCTHVDRLPLGNLRFFVKNNSSHLTDQDNILARQAIGAAFESWNRELASLGIDMRFVPTGDRSSADIILRWGSSVASTLDPACDFEEATPGGKVTIAITEGFRRVICLNDRDDFWNRSVRNLGGFSVTGVFPLDCGDRRGQSKVYDLQAAVTHEIGHLFDLPDNNFDGSTMFHEQHWCDTSQRNIHSLDEESVKKRYNISSLPPQPPPQGVLDSPVPNATVSGPVPLFGWAIDQATPSARLSLTLLIDGGPVSASFTQGGARPDVCAIFPESSFPGACQSGFSTTWNPAGLTGAHTVAVRVTNGGGLSTLLGPVPVAVTGAPPPPPSCTFSISPAGQSFGAGGGTGSVSVTAPSGCSWTAVSNSVFITITSGASGRGNGTVTYSVAPNTSTSSRTRTLTIAGQTFTVTQAAGAACTFSISPTSASFFSSGNAGSVSVRAPSGCRWTARSNADWITITSGSSGRGNGTVTYSVAGTTVTFIRTGTLTIAGQTFTVTQDGRFCSVSISPRGASFPASGGEGSVSVTASNDCFWDVQNSAEFITIISPGRLGSFGDGQVRYFVAPNTSTSSREGLFSIGSDLFKVTQAGVSTGPTTGPTGNERVTFFLNESFNSSTGIFTGSIVITVTSTRPGATVSAQFVGLPQSPRSTTADSAGSARLFVPLPPHCHPATTPACGRSDGDVPVRVDGILIGTIILSGF